MAASPQSPDNLSQFRYLAGTNFETGITATASGTQAAAYQLSAQMSDISVCATALDSVALPKITVRAPNEANPGSLGMLVFVYNGGAAAAQVYGGTNAKDTINGVATATGVLLPAGALMFAWPTSYTQSTDVGTWRAMISAGGGGGELLTSTLAAGSALSETTATPLNVTSLSVTPGTWDLAGVVDRTLTGTTATIYNAGISLTTATMPSQAGGSGLGTDPLVNMSATFGTTITGNFSTAIPSVQLVIAATTTVFLVAADTFSAGTIAVFGTLRARRIK